MFSGSSSEEKTPLLSGNEVERETQHIIIPISNPKVQNENVDKPEKPTPIDKDNNGNDNNDNNSNPSNYVFPLRRAQHASPMRGRSRSRGPNRKKSFVFLSDNDTDDIVRTDEQGNLLFALPNSRKMSVSFDQENTDGDSIQLFSRNYKASQGDGKTEERKSGLSKRKRGNPRKSREKLTRPTPMIKIAEDEVTEEPLNKFTKDTKKKEPQQNIEENQPNATAALPIFPVLKPNFSPSMRLRPARSRNIPPLMGSIDEEEEEADHHEKPEKKQVSYRFPILPEKSATNEKPTFNQPLLSQSQNLNLDQITEDSEEENKSKGNTTESTTTSSRHPPRLLIYGGHPSLHACAVRRKPLTESRDSSDKEKEKTQTSTPSSFTNQISLSGQVESGIKCLVARTALILPFSFGNHQLPSSYWIQHLINRHIVDEKGTRIQLWEQKDILPQEVAELSRQFRQMVGWQDREGRFTINTWRCRRLVLTKNARELLFKNAHLWAVQREGNIEKDITREVHVGFIELLLFPLGLGILMYKINWLPKNKTSRRNSLVNAKGVAGANKHSDDSSGGEESTPTRSRANLLGSSSVLEENMANSKDPFLLEELRTWLYVAKFRHTVPHVVKGWTFEGRGRKSKTVSEGETETENMLPEHCISLGKRMSRALYERKPISLNAVGNWLLLFDDEDPISPPARLGYGGHAYHHSTVVIDREPSPLTLQEYLFHLRRAFGQKNRPPYLFNQVFRSNLNSSNEAMGSNFEPFGGLDQILIPRLNRHIGISREGIVCITWSTDTNAKPVNFDVSKWHKKFQGIYLILSLHTFGERAVLEELSTLAAFQADNMKLEAGTGSMLAKGIDVDIQKSRNEMKELATLVARFTISMSSDDCGGPSEYSEFFTTLRRVFGIPTKRAELREELQDTLALLESSYLEERRKLKVEEQREEKSERERIRKVRLMKEAHKHKYDTMFSAISSLTIPAVLLSSIFGMNIEELPSIKFWNMIILIGAISLIALVLQLICFRGIEKYEPLEGTLVNEPKPRKKDWFKRFFRRNKQEQQQQQQDAAV